MLNQSHDPPQLQGNVHLCKLNECQDNGDLRLQTEIILSLQMNYYLLLINFGQN